MVEETKLEEMLGKADGAHPFGPKAPPVINVDANVDALIADLRS